MFFNEQIITAIAQDRIARLREDAAIRRCAPSPRESVARFFKRVATKLDPTLETGSSTSLTKGGSYVR